MNVAFLLRISSTSHHVRPSILSAHRGAHGHISQRCYHTEVSSLSVNKFDLPVNWHGMIDMQKIPRRAPYTLSGVLRRKYTLEPPKSHGEHVKHCGGGNGNLFFPLTWARWTHRSLSRGRNYSFLTISSAEDFGSEKYVTILTRSFPHPVFSIVVIVIMVRGPFKSLTKRDISKAVTLLLKFTAKKTVPQMAIRVQRNHEMNSFSRRKSEEIPNHPDSTWAHLQKDVKCDSQVEMSGY